MTHKLQLAATVGLAALALGACTPKLPSMMNSDDKMEEANETMMQDDSMVEENDSMMKDDSATESDSMMMHDEQAVEVEGGSFYFKPNVITVKKGQPVKIVLSSADMMHDFVIDELNVRSEIVKAGDTGEVTFTPTEAGEFEFYCSVGNHRAQGMIGTLVVEE